MGSHQFTQEQSDKIYVQLLENLFKPNKRSILKFDHSKFKKSIKIRNNDVTMVHDYKKEN